MFDDIICLAFFGTCIVCVFFKKRCSKICTIQSRSFTLYNFMLAILHTNIKQAMCKRINDQYFLVHSILNFCSQGWQYAVNFTSRWTAESHWKSCVRKRKWIRFCRFTDANTWATVRIQSVIQLIELEQMYFQSWTLPFALGISM